MIMIVFEGDKHNLLNSNYICEKYLITKSLKNEKGYPF